MGLELTEETLARRGRHPELGPVTLPRSPVRYEGSAPRQLTPSPFLGEHTAAVLEDWLGLGAADVADLRSKGAL